MHFPHYKLLRYFEQYEFASPYSLSTSDCEPLSIGELLGYEKSAEKQFKELKLGYVPPKGGEALRKTISKEYTQINPDQVLVTTGSEEAIFLFLMTALKKGDHIIVQTPCFQPYYEIPRSLGCDVTFWESKEDKDWETDPAELKQLINKNTRLLIMSSPAHPTGYLLPSKKLFDIVEIARENGLLVFCDETYSGLEHEPQERLPKFCDIYEKGISMGSMSKAYGLPGLRLGWLATKEKILLHEILALKDYTTVAGSSTSEFLAELALRHGEKILKHNLALVRSNAELLHDFVKKYHDLFDCKMPQAGCVALLHLKKRADAVNFCADLMEKTKALLVPSACYEYGKRHVRIGFGHKNFPLSLNELESYILMAPHSKSA